MASQKISSVAVNYMYSLLFQILTIVAPLITTPYVSRILQADGIGAFSLTTTNASYFTLVGVFGLGTYGQLEIAKAKDNLVQISKLFFEIMLVRLLTHAVCIAAYAVLVVANPQYRTLYLIQGLLLLASMLDVTWFFQGMEEFKRVAIRNIVIKAVGVALIFLLVKQKSDLPVYTLINTGSTLLGNLCLYPVLKKYVRKVKFQALNPWRHVVKSTAFFLPSIASVIIASVDKTMIGIITQSEAENGYYELAYRIELVCFCMFASLNMVMRSKMAYLSYNSREDEMKRYLMESIRFVSLIACPISLGIIGVSRTFVPWYFGDGYTKVMTLLQVFSMWMFFKGNSNCLLEQYVMASGRQRTFNIIIWIGAVFNACANAVLIRMYQSVGAAMASVGAEIFIFVLALYASRDVISPSVLLKGAYKYIVSAAVMLVVVLAVSKRMTPGGYAMLAQICTGAVIYMLCVLLLRDELVLETLGSLFKGRGKG